MTNSLNRLRDRIRSRWEGTWSSPATAAECKKRSLNWAKSFFYKTMQKRQSFLSWVMNVTEFTSSKKVPWSYMWKGNIVRSSQMLSTSLKDLSWVKYHSSSRPKEQQVLSVGRITNCSLSISETSSCYNRSARPFSNEWTSNCTPIAILLSKTN